MKRIIVLISAAAVSLALCATALAWNANGVNVSVGCSNGTYVVSASIVQNAQYPATLKSVTPSTFAGTSHGGVVTVVVGFANGETQTFSQIVSLAGDCSASPQTNRQGYCAPDGKFYDLVVGQDQYPPYDALHLVPAVNGTCFAPVIVSLKPVAPTAKKLTAKKPTAKPKPVQKVVKTSTTTAKKIRVVTPKRHHAKKHKKAPPVSHVGVGKG